MLLVIFLFLFLLLCRKIETSKPPVHSCPPHKWRYSNDQGMGLICEVCRQTPHLESRGQK